jgi:hypothetical protein
MLIVQSKDKENYLNALHRADVNAGLIPSDGANATLDQVEPFINYIETLAKHALEIAIKAGKGESIEVEDDWKKELSLKMQEAKKAPLFSIEIAQLVQKETIYKIVKGIDDSLAEYELMFDRVDRILVNGNDSIFGRETEEILSIPANYNYKKGFRFQAAYSKTVLYINKVFEYKLYAYFYERKYKISLHISEENIEITKKYNEFVSDDEINNYINFTGKRLSQFVKEEILKDE